jgi:VCBS repeat protein
MAIEGYRPLRLGLAAAILVFSLLPLGGGCGGSSGVGPGEGGADGSKTDAGESGATDANKPHDSGSKDTQTTGEAGSESSTDAGAPTAAPRPIAPLSTSRVTSRKPTLHWALPAGVTQATVDLCLDRACAMPIGTPALVTGTTYAPTTELAPGVVYWRVHPDKDTSLTSPTWEFTVGAVSAAHDTSWGTSLDVNGDGLADLAVGAFNKPACDGGDCPGVVYVYLGSTTGLPSTPNTTLPTPPSATLGDVASSVSSAGDVNGDGYGDLVVATGTTGAIDIYLGSATGLPTTPSAKVQLTSGSSVYKLAAAGDVNGDGYADIIVGSCTTGCEFGTGIVYGVYLGSATGLGTSAAQMIASTLSATAVASAGDVNGDGFGDVILGLGATGGSSMGNVYIYLGGTSGLGASPAATLTDGVAGGYFGSTIASAGDVNGDGYADIIVGEGSKSEAFVYLGSAAGITSGETAATTLIGTSMDYAFVVSGAGDVNGDGYSDVAVGDVLDGDVYVYLGSASGVTVTPAASITSPGGYTGAIASAGDTTGKGYSSLAVGSPDVSTSVGAVYVYPGGSSLSTTPTTLSNPGGASVVFFGTYLFGSNY